MLNNTSTHHVHIDIYDTAQQVLAVFDDRRVIVIFPICALSTLTLVVFLSRSTGHKLDRFGNNIFSGNVVDQQVKKYGWMSPCSPESRAHNAFLPHTATVAIGDDLWQTSAEIHGYDSDV
jgi:hypothetical protein